MYVRNFQCVIIVPEFVLGEEWRSSCGVALLYKNLNGTQNTLARSVHRNEIEQNEFIRSKRRNKLLSFDRTHRTALGAWSGSQHFNDLEK